MATKLTLSMDETVIKRAKEYAGKNHRSLSELVENFFRVLTAETDRDQPVYPPLTTGLSGVIKAADIGDSRDQYTQYLQDKYQ